MRKTRPVTRVFDALYAMPEIGDYQPFLDELRAATGSSVVNGILVEPNRAGGYITSVSGIGEADYRQRESAYFEFHGGFNPMMAAVQHVLSTGTVLRASDFVPFPALRESAYFREFMHPLNADYTAGIVVDSGAGGTSWLSLSKAVGADDYTDAELALLRDLSAPLQRVCRLLAATPADGAGWQVLSASGVAAAVVDAELRCLRTTSAMDELLAGGSPLAIRARTLRGAWPAVDARLRALRNKVESAGTGLAEAAPEYEFDDPGGWRWALTVISEPVGLPTGARLVILRRVRRLSDRRRRMIDRFGLTPAEARCALALARTPDSRDLARALGLSANTVKSQLRAVFGKTGTASRVRLLALLAREGLLDECSDTESAASD